MLRVVPLFHYLGSDTRTFDVTDPATGSSLVCNPGDTVVLPDDPGSPWLVEDPDTAAAKAFAKDGTQTPPEPPEPDETAAVSPADPPPAPKPRPRAGK